MIWDYGYFNWSGRHLEWSEEGRDLSGHGRHYLSHPHDTRAFQRQLQTDRKVLVEWRGREYHTKSNCSFAEGEMNGEDDVSKWHQDGLNTPYVITWATNAPTEIRLPGGEIFTGEPGHLIVFDNQKVMHRTGRRGYDPETREFARAMVESQSEYNPYRSYANGSIGFPDDIWHPDPAFMINPHRRLTWDRHLGMV